MLGNTKEMKRTRLRPISKKRQAEMKIYAKERKAFLEENPICQICGNDKSEVIHHGRGRTGSYYLDKRYWKAVSIRCHAKAEKERLWARQNGHSFDRIGINPFYHE